MALKKRRLLRNERLHDDFGARVGAVDRVVDVLLAHLAVVAVALAIAGLVVLVSAGQLGLTLALWFGALLFLAVSRNPRRWL